MELEVQLLLGITGLVIMPIILYKLLKLCIKLKVDEEVLRVISLLDIPSNNTQYLQNKKGECTPHKPASTGMLSEISHNQNYGNYQNKANRPQNKHVFQCLINIIHKCIIKRVKSCCQPNQNDTNGVIPRAT